MGGSQSRVRNEDTYLEEGNRLYNLGEYEEAIKCYNQAISINPNHTDAYNNKGIAL